MHLHSESLTLLPLPADGAALGRQARQRGHDNPAGQRRRRRQQQISEFRWRTFLFFYFHRF